MHGKFAKSLKTGFSHLFVCEMISDICESQYNYNTSFMITGSTINNIDWWFMKHSQFYFHEDSISCKSFVPQLADIMGESKNLREGRLPLKYTLYSAAWIRMRMEYYCW